jgi:hypothetical protein
VTCGGDEVVRAAVPVELGIGGGVFGGDLSLVRSGWGHRGMCRCGMVVRWRVALEGRSDRRGTHGDPQVGSSSSECHHRPTIIRHQEAFAHVGMD